MAHVTMTDWPPGTHPMRRVDDHMPDIEPRRVSRWERVLIPLVVAAVAVFVTSAVWTLVRPASFQPLTYEVQRVVVIDEDLSETVPQVEGFDDLIPSLRVGDVVPVVGRICNDATDPISVSGVVQWNRLSPRGLNIETGRGTNDIAPGCKVLGPFENDMPQAVIDDVIRSGRPERWQISGVVTIDEPNGGTTFWQTEAFWVVP